MLDVRHLRHLIAVAEEGTLQKASDRLNITQPALTKSIRALETYLNSSLFDRVGRGMQLTDLGAELVESGRRILRSVRDTEQMIENWNKGDSGRITIGLGPAYTVLLSANLIETVISRFASVRLQLETGDTTNLVARLLEDTIDIAVCDIASVPKDQDIVAIDLKPQAIVALVRSGHPLSMHTRPTMASLENFPVGHSPAPDQFADFSANIAASGKLCLSENYDALAQVAKTSDLVVLLPRNLAEAYVEPGLFDLIDIEGIPQQSAPKILYRQGSKLLPPLGHKLVEHIQSNFAPSTTSAA